MINLYLNISKQDITKLILDITKYTTIIVTIHLLLYSIDNEGELFNEKILKIILYMAIGIIIYNLLIKRIILSYIYKK